MPSPAKQYHVIVVGVGGMGSAVAYHLARRKRSVLGLERYDIPHAMGSSHGVSRIIRMAYFEHPSYVPLLRRAYELWRELERAAEEQLLYITGSIDAGRPDSPVLQGSLTSCRAHDLTHEVLSASELMRRYAAYRLPGDVQAVLQPDGGFLLSERCIVAHTVLAQAAGAEIHARERALAWEPANHAGVRVTTDRGVYEAGRLVLCAGAWASDLIPELGAHAVPERQVVGWFQPGRLELFQLNRFPVFNLTVDEGHFYGFPVHGVPGFKVGRYHHLGERVDPETMDRESHPADERVLREFTARYFPDAAGPTMALKTCLFTNTPDDHFVLDLHPEYPQVAIAAGFSGHGFKFASVVGEVMADLADRGETRHDIERFRLARLLDVDAGRRGGMGGE